MKTKALIVDDNKDYAIGVSENLSLYGIHAITASTIKEAQKAAHDYKPKVIFIDICLGEENGIELLKSLKPKLPDTIFIMITGYGTIDSAIQSLKLGAKDYLQKPVQFESILQSISEINISTPHKNDRNYLKETAHSKKMQSIIECIDKIAETDLPILISGENGTGKELVADYIVNKSQDKDSPYVKINSSAFTASLLDNELFGHEKGAYTGAESTFRGVFERANGGTLFLDEIGDMPLTIQAKILRAVQNKEIRRIGSEKVITIEVRLIAATNKDLQHLISTGHFRQDLYYRLNTAHLSLPPLRERREDIEKIAELILSDIEKRNSSSNKKISNEVLDLFHCYSWPGNIRELKNCLLYAAAMSPHSKEIQLNDLPGNILQQEECFDSFSNLEEAERNTIIQALETTQYNKSKTASLLSISRSTLYQKLKKYGIDVYE